MSRTILLFFIPLLLLILLESCSSHRSKGQQRKQYSSQTNLQAATGVAGQDQWKFFSLERYDLQDQSLNQFPAPLVSCYRGEFEQGLKQLRQQLSGQEKNPDYWNQVASCYFWKKEDLKAKYYLSLGLGIDADHLELNHNLALVYARLKRSSLALALFERLHEQHPQLEILTLNYAIFLYQQGSFDQSKTLLTGLSDFGRSEKVSSLYLLKNALALGDLDLLIKSFEQPLYQTWAEELEFRNLYVHALIDRGDFVRARQWMARSYARSEPPVQINYWKELQRKLVSRTTARTTADTGASP